MIKSDIDIDVPDRQKALAALGRYTNASQINGDVIKPHNVGVYLQDIPEFMNSGMASIGYKEAPNYGFFKLDILTNTVYEDVKDEAHLDKLLNTEPDWDMLLDYKVSSTLFQIHRYARDLDKWKPRNMVQLAMFIAMIRPSKKHLMECNSWETVEKEIWIPPTDGSQYFKKSHAMAYSAVIVIQLNLIREA